MQSHIKASIVLGVFLLGGFVAHAQEREGALMPSIEEFNQMTVEEKMKFFEEDYQALAPDQKELVREKLSGVPVEAASDESTEVPDDTQLQNVVHLIRARTNLHSLLGKSTIRSARYGYSSYKLEGSG